MPILLTALTAIVFLWLNLTFALFKHNEFVKSLNDLLQLMIVFYMAALAAVATFERKGIDGPLKGGDATLTVLHHDENKPVVKVLSYRQFISYLFGYLSFLSLCLYIFVLFFSVAWPEFEKKFSFGLGAWIFTHIIDPTIFLFVIFALWQLTFTSLLGIYFLTERIQSLNDVEN